MKNREISIIIPSYKAEKYICRAIESCLIQKEVDVEVIVVEDGVFDNTAQVLKKYENDTRIKYYTLKKNMGACYARNYGMNLASYEYIVFLDADDYFEGLILKGMNDSLVNNKASVVFSIVERKSDKHIYNKFIPSKNENNISVISRMISGHAGPPPCGIMWLKSEIIRIGGWNEDYTKNQDGELIIRAMFESVQPTYNMLGKAIYWQHDGNRVSTRANLRAFKDQEKLEQYIQLKINKNPNQYSEIENYLNGYRFGVMLRAYCKNMPDIYSLWERKMTKSRG